MGLKVRVLVFLAFVVLGSFEFVKYDPQVYNQLADYAIARQHAFEHDYIGELGKIFMDFGVNDTFGLCLLHNHFHIALDEQMVEVVFNDTSRTDPRPIADIDSSAVKPSMMALNEKGQLIPLEFLDIRSSAFGGYETTLYPVLQRFYSHTEDFKDFFRTLALKLMDIQRLDVFGVCIRHRDSITAVDPTNSSLETNHPRERWLRLDPMIYHASKKDIIAQKWKRGEASPTYWSFPSKCNACNDQLGGLCAECGCGGGVCAECGCFM